MLMHDDTVEPILSERLSMQEHLLLWLNSKLSYRWHAYGERHLCRVSQDKLSAESLQQDPPFQRHGGRHGQN